MNALSLTSRTGKTYNHGKMDGILRIAKNKKAHFHYTVEETVECGIVLEGSEVKSIRSGNISFPDAFAEISPSGEVWLKNFHISPYTYASVFLHEPDRPKKLLLHRTEIKRLQRKTMEKGYTLVPLEFYIKKGKVKLLLGLCKGKKLYDKRADIRERDVSRDLQREFAHRQDG